MVMIKPMFNGKLGVIRVVTSHQGFTRAFSIRVFVTRNVVPTVIVYFKIDRIIRYCVYETIVKRFEY